MIFENLRINNFLTIGNVECSLNNKGLVLIQGDNRDDTSQNSNGAGKSSFPDAILWCLFGSTARGESGDRVVNRKAKKDCFVEVTLTDNGSAYIITRYRKHQVEKNRLTVFQEISGTRTDLTKGTDKLTQDLVTKILGCSEEVFCAAIYSGQEAMPDLPGMTDKQLKTIVEEAAGIDRLQEAHSIAQKKLRLSKSELLIENGKMVSTKEMIANSEDHLARLSLSKDAFENNRTEELKAISAKLRDQKKELEEASLESKAAAIEIEKLQEQAQAIQTKIDAIDSEKDQEKVLSDKLNGEKIKVSTLANQYSQLAKEYKKASEACKSIHSNVGKPCGECGKDYTEDDLEEASKLAEQKRLNIKKDAEAVKFASDSMIKATQIVAKELLAFRDAMTSISKELTQRDSIVSQMKPLMMSQSKVEDVKNELRKTLTDLKRSKANENPHLPLIESTEKSIKAMQAKLVGQNKLVSDKEKEIKVDEATEKVFGPAGVRAHILDSVTPFLNHRTAEYLGTLTDENITASWSTLSTTAKGDIREKFVIDVNSKVGGGNFKSLSGGEKRKVRLACSMALQDLVSSRASKPIELYIADEIDDAVDEAGLERLMSILDDKAKTKGTALVISHNSLSDWIRNSVTIVKENGSSRLEGVL